MVFKYQYLLMSGLPLLLQYSYMPVLYPICGRGAMVRAWSFANFGTCRVASNPAWCRIFREI